MARAVESPLVALKCVWGILVALQIFLHGVGAFEDKPWSLLYLVCTTGALTKLIIALDVPGGTKPTQKSDSAESAPSSSSSSDGALASGQTQGVESPQTPQRNSKQVRCSTPRKSSALGETAVVSKGLRDQDASGTAVAKAAAAKSGVKKAGGKPA